MRTRSPPIVLATRVPNIAKATKLKTAAQITAYRGDSTRVETTVAIELAASWKPLVKSKISATKTIKNARATVVVIGVRRKYFEMNENARHSITLSIEWLVTQAQNSRKRNQCRC